MLCILQQRIGLAISGPRFKELKVISALVPLAVSILSWRRRGRLQTFATTTYVLIDVMGTVIDYKAESSGHTAQSVGIASDAAPCTQSCQIHISNLASSLSVEAFPSISPAFGPDCEQDCTLGQSGGAANRNHL